MSATAELTVEQTEILRTIRDFVDRDVLPNVSRYDHADEFPAPLVQTMKELGLFGTTIPVEYGGLGLDLTTYALIVEELSRGWISLSGVINTHFMASFMIKTFGTEEQKDRLLPRMAAGEIRSAFSMTEPIANHQLIQAKIANMATKIRAAELLMLDAARRKDCGERADLEAGMAKLFATEVAEEAALEAMRIHGGYGYSPEYPIERLYRDAPVLLLGEGSNEIQQLLIARRIFERYETGAR